MRGIYPAEAATDGAEPLDDRARKTRDDFRWGGDPLVPLSLMALLVLLTVYVGVLTARTWHRTRNVAVDALPLDLGWLVALDGLMVMLWIAAVGGYLLARRRVSQL